MRAHRHFAARPVIVLTVSLLFGASAYSDSRACREAWRARPYRGDHVWRFPYENERRPSARDLRGTVESVDARGNTFVIHSAATGSFITVVRRDRRIEPQPGDFVSISGPWNRRTGRLEGYSIRLLE